MNKCLVCGTDRGKRPKHCSKVCTKRAWYFRKNPDAYRLNPATSNKRFWDSETGIGFKWEKWAAEFLGARHRAFERGCDLEKDGILIDVKVCRIYRRKNRRGVPVKSEQFGNWVFNRNKPKPCGFFFCICLDKEGKKIVKILMIPDDKFPKSGCVVGEKSTYDIFKVATPKPWFSKNGRMG